MSVDCILIGIVIFIFSADCYLEHSDATSNYLCFPLRLRSSGIRLYISKLELKGQEG